MVSVQTPRGSVHPYHAQTLRGKRLLVKTVRPRQELQVPAGVAVDESVLEWAASEGFEGIAVRRELTGELVWALVSHWARGIPIRRGFGPQRALLWSQLLPLSEHGTQAPTAEQTGLFGA